MKRLLPWLVAAALGAATVASNLPSSEPGSSPERTVYSAVYALNHNNTGRACSYTTDEFRVAKCPPEDNSLKVVPGSRIDHPNGSVSYRVLDTWSGTEITFVLVQNADGKWRIHSLVY